MSEQQTGIDDLILRRPEPLPPPDRLFLRDEAGQSWAITVATDGQLQTAKAEMPKLEINDSKYKWSPISLSELLGDQGQKA